MKLELFPAPMCPRTTSVPSSCLQAPTTTVETADGAAFPSTAVGGGSSAFAAPGLDPGRLTLGPQHCDGRLEVLQRFETLVDTGESQVRDFVELAQRAEDGQADLVRLDLGGSGRPDLLLDALGEQGQLVLSDGPALAGLHR